MWICHNCSEEVEEQFGVCWNCEADRQGTLPTGSSSDRDAEEREAEDMERKAFLNEKFRSKHCLRCNIALRYAGKKEFHEGLRLGALGDFAELFVGQVRLEMYVCPNCRRVEFFAFDLRC
jgi:predicted ATP-dependent serine protease